MTRDRIIHYVGFARIEDWLRCGWIIARPNCSTMYTDLYGATMEWLCDCRKFVGIEIDPGYFDIACRRIDDALKQPDMFIEQPARARQAELDLTTGR